MCSGVLVHLLAWEQGYGVDQPGFKSFHIQNLGGQRRESEGTKTTCGGVGDLSGEANLRDSLLPWSLFPGLIPFEFMY